MSSKYPKESLINRSYNLLKDWISLMVNFPKSHKFQLGNRIQVYLSDLMENYLKAYYSSKSEKQVLLKEANLQIEILRHYTRLCFDLRLISAKKYGSLSIELDEMGRMTGAWLKKNKDLLKS